MKRMPLLLLPFALPAICLAQPPGKNIDTQLQECKLHANSTSDNAQCYSVAIQQWDGELNKQYQLLINS